MPPYAKGIRQPSDRFLLHFSCNQNGSFAIVCGRLTDAFGHTEYQDPFQTLTALW
jgi:hypothetical protein